MPLMVMVILLGSEKSTVSVTSIVAISDSVTLKNRGCLAAFRCCNGLPSILLFHQYQFLKWFSLVDHR